MVRTKKGNSLYLRYALATAFPASYRLASDPLDANYPQTGYKQYKKRPAEVPEAAVKNAPVAPPEIEEVQAMLARVNEHLARISAVVTDMQAKMAAEIARVKSEMGEAAELEERQRLYNKLGALLELAENKTVKVGDNILTLYEEDRPVPFKPTPQWKLEKLLEHFQDAEAYLEKAIQGAQNMATTEHVREVREFPDKTKKASAETDAVHTLIDDILNYVAELDAVEKLL